jgi:hypothetical protein
MVTQTTPSRANAVTSYSGSDPDPLVNEPPWVHTSTGRPCARGSGVQTLKFRYSSPKMSTSGSRCLANSAHEPLAAVGPNLRASRTPSHSSAGRGGRKRPGPAGAAA